MHKPTLKIDEVAEALSISLRSFRIDRQRLEAAGFPKPLPALRAVVWSRAQVEAWIASNGEPDPAGAAHAANVVPFVAAARDALSHRYSLAERSAHAGAKREEWGRA